MRPSYTLRKFRKPSEMNHLLSIAAGAIATTFELDDSDGIGPRKSGSVNAYTDYRNIEIAIKFVRKIERKLKHRDRLRALCERNQKLVRAQ